MYVQHSVCWSLIGPQDTKYIQYRYTLQHCWKLQGLTGLSDGLSCRAVPSLCRRQQVCQWSAGGSHLPNITPCRYVLTPCTGINSLTCTPALCLKFCFNHTCMSHGNLAASAKVHRAFINKLHHAQVSGTLQPVNCISHMQEPCDCPNLKVGPI